MTNIPSAYYYVTCHDTFMSGWGLAEGKKNVLVFLCDSEAEANIVAENAKDRGDQKYIKTHFYAPKGIIRNSRNYVQFKTKEDMPTWYKKAAFKDS